MGTPFTKVYNRFLGKITDDMYIELTPEDTIKDLQNLIIDAIPGFEFPRKNLMDYEIKTAVKREDELFPDDFVITGSQNMWYAQVGNAVPVKLAKAIGTGIMKFLNETS